MTDGKRLILEECETKAAECRELATPRRTQSGGGNLSQGWVASGRSGWNKLFEAALLQMLVEAPTLDLLHDFVELRLRDALINEAFAAREFAEVPGLVLELGRHRHFPKRHIFRQIGLQCLFGAVERLEVFGQHAWLHLIGHP